MFYPGVNENDPSAPTSKRLDPELLKRKYPGVLMTREFAGDGKPFSQGTIIWDKIWERAKGPVASGLKPVVSFKLLPAEVNNGSWDAELIRFGRSLNGSQRRGEDIWIVYWHEPENNLAPADFVKAFNRIYDILKKESWRTQIGPAYMIYHWLPKWDDPTKSVAGKTDVPSAWWTKADFYGADVYSGNTQPLTAHLGTHKGFQRWRKALPIDNRPVFLMERGAIATSAQYATRVKMIQDDLAYMGEDTRIDGYLYWNTVGTENNPNLVLDASGENALKTLVRDTADWDRPEDNGQVPSETRELAERIQAILSEYL